MKIKLTAYNKKCPNSCLQGAITLDKRHKMFAPGGLGGSFQFSVVNDIPLRTSSIIVDMAGPYEILCELEIFDDSSSASIVSALIRYMSHHGSKNIFLSDMGSNFWPLATRYATIPDEELKTLPPMWKNSCLRTLRLCLHMGVTFGFILILKGTRLWEGLNLW